MPTSADKPVFRLAPYLSILPAFLAFSIVPIGGAGEHRRARDVPPAGRAAHRRALAAGDVGPRPLRRDAGGLVVGLEVPAARLGAGVGPAASATRPRSASRSSACWSSRARCRRAGSSTDRRGTGWARRSATGTCVPAFVAFVIFLIAAIAETNHPPFDLVEAEQELVGGFHTEYTGIRFAIFFLAEFMNVITMSRDRGHAVPRRPRRARRSASSPTTAPSTCGSCRCSGSWPSCCVLLFGTVWIRASLPRLRYDQLMDLGWKYLIEIAFLWIMVSARLVIGREEDWNLLDRRARSRGRGALLVYGAAVPVDAEARRAARARDQVRALMGRFSGFAVTLRQMFRPRDHRHVPGGEATQAAALPRPSRPQPLRGRHGEVHRLRAVRGRVPGALHLRARRRQPARRAGRAGERYGFVYEINYLRCIHCDLCVEACPTEAITETKLFEFSFTNRDDAIYTKDELLVDDDGRARRLPWEQWARRRGRRTPAPGCGSTSPSGAAAYEGEVEWSGELGFGVRAPGAGPEAASGTVDRRRRVIFFVFAALALGGPLGVVLGAQPGALRARCSW